MEIVTPHGPARAEIDPVPAPRFLLVLTHGSAGGVDAPDLLAVRDAVLGIGGLVARVTQPFRLRGARAPGSAVKQDEAWAAAVAEVRRSHPGLPLVQGGRSNGARVACRTAGAVGAEAVVALAFPLHPPSRPERSRAQELRAAGVDVLAVSGDRDPFGVPAAEDVARLVVLPGEGHDLKKDPALVGEAVAGWLDSRARARR
ncbi:alpha/beta hydrolase [Planomonospora parontospora subsp. parontospora]|uniref:Alpha/beta hydrolase n=2 Tax=Planomonospora parontospora TaxID=58119 RepID=A0AA37BJY0_9ACTN|nr:alpha/beta family hydrolase [Planomonospora parontospora]GGK82395.1 alpha/beta hydrolase [Planomonospora parontospora]GII10943.1 alpha/beta hydrolase [Planomonospora parontospora subsp. parontospora]